MIQFSRPLTWLAQALHVTRITAPDHLEPTMQGVLDLLQGGWAVASWRTVTTQQPASQPPQMLQMLAADGELTRVAWGMCRHDGGAAPGIVRFDFMNPIAALSTCLGTLSIAVGATGGHAQIFNSSHPIIIPPGFELNVIAPATGVGETYTFNLAIGTMPAGFNPQ